MVESYIIEWVRKDINNKFFSHRRVFIPGEEEIMTIFIERLKSSDYVCKISKITIEV